MTKQEEIREGIAKWLYMINCDAPEEAWHSHYEHVKANWRLEAEKILSYLHSQGVVIKVEGELPYLEHWDWRQRSHAKNIYYDLLLEAGYVAVEPLIKEE